MSERKRNTSVRLNAGDVRRLRCIAGRLQVNESELLRFCVKQTLNKLSPLDEPDYKGADLMPALLEVGEALTRYFEFDSRQLQRIVNGEETESARSVCDADVDLFVLSVWNENSVLHRIKDLADDMHLEVNIASSFLRSYLFDKYVPVDRRRGGSRPDYSTT
jgi:putative heme degradation protein